MLRKTIITMCIVGLLVNLLPLVFLPDDKVLRMSWMSSDPAYEWINRPRDYSTTSYNVRMTRYWAIGKAKGYLEVWRYGSPRPGALYLPMRIPIRQMALLFATISAYLIAFPYLRRFRRRKQGLCVKCAYDLTGNTSGVCPECGTNVVGYSHEDRSKKA